MRFPLTVLALTGALFAPIAHSDECVTSETPLVQLLNQYSQDHGTRFIVDPRVRAKVTLVGINPDELDSGTLIGVLNIHGYTALAKDGNVYVMPDAIAQRAGDKFGDRWDG